MSAPADLGDSLGVLSLVPRHLSGRGQTVDQSPAGQQVCQGEDPDGLRESRQEHSQTHQNLKTILFDFL